MRVKVRSGELWVPVASVSDQKVLNTQRSGCPVTFGWTFLQRAPWFETKGAFVHSANYNHMGERAEKKRKHNREERVNWVVEAFLICLRGTRVELGGETR